MTRIVHRDTSCEINEPVAIDVPKLGVLRFLDEDVARADAGCDGRVLARF
jgi:hypothetical protein